MKETAEKAIAQLEEEQFFQQIDPESNSIAILIQHLHGNMKSRWTDFLHSDGEKNDRNRDREFELHVSSRDELMQLWNEGWSYVFAALELLSSEDLLKTVTIRNQPHSVIQAIQRQMYHYSYHVGQIVFMAKHFCSEDWKSLTIPKGESEKWRKNSQEGMNQ
jgi:hypothetical protein